jgi:hypothetical protein
VVVSLLVERWGLSVDEALEAFAAARPPGVKHERFREELHARYGGGARRGCAAPSGAAGAAATAETAATGGGGGSCSAGTCAAAAAWGAAAGAAAPLQQPCSCTCGGGAGSTCSSSSCSCAVAAAAADSPGAVRGAAAACCDAGPRGCAAPGGASPGRWGVAVPWGPAPNARPLGGSPGAPLPPAMSLASTAGSSGSWQGGGAAGSWQGGGGAAAAGAGTGAGSDGDNSSIGGSVGGSPDVSGGAMHLVAEMLAGGSSVGAAARAGGLARALGRGGSGGLAAAAAAGAHRSPLNGGAAAAAQPQQAQRLRPPLVPPGGGAGAALPAAAPAAQQRGASAAEAGTSLRWVGAGGGVSWSLAFLALAQRPTVLIYPGGPLPAPPPQQPAARKLSGRATAEESPMAAPRHGSTPRTRVPSPNPVHHSRFLCSQAPGRCPPHVCPHPSECNRSPCPLGLVLPRAPLASLFAAPRLAHAGASCPSRWAPPCGAATLGGLPALPARMALACCAHH